MKQRLPRIPWATWRPKLFETLPAYDRHAFTSDLGAPQQPAAFLHQAEFMEHVGAKNIVPHVEAALARAQEIQAGF